MPLAVFDFLQLSCKDLLHRVLGFCTAAKGAVSHNNNQPSLGEGEKHGERCRDCSQHPQHATGCKRTVGYCIHSHCTTHIMLSSPLAQHFGMISMCLHVTHSLCDVPSLYIYLRKSSMPPAPSPHPPSALSPSFPSGPSWPCAGQYT